MEFITKLYIYNQVGMKSEGLLKEHEVRRRDLLILKYDKQRSLCDEIILRQQKLIEGRSLSNIPNTLEIKLLIKSRIWTF